MGVTTIGVIGGSGLEEVLKHLGPGEVQDVETPYGEPSAPIVMAEVGGIRVALLKRHGEGHVHPPSMIPYRANIFALKALGVTHILATGAVGSLREEIAPRSLVVPDQVIDRTHRRVGTFFDDLAVHVEFGAPFCPSLRKLLAVCATGFPVRVHHGGTYVCMEGPAFSTRAESELHRSWGASLIGMTIMPEAKLAREAEICYAVVSLPTDYDCWRQAPQHLEGGELIQEILGNLRAGSASALELIRRVVVAMAATEPKPCACQSALALGIWTDRSRVPPETVRRLHPILGRHLDPKG
jgi:5'-methylthioadenosine phosphorylase